MFFVSRITAPKLEIDLNVCNYVEKVHSMCNVEFSFQIFRVTEQLNNVKIITEQKLGDGRKVYIPQEAKYQIRNESNYLLNLNFAKKDRF